MDWHLCSREGTENMSGAFSSRAKVRSGVPRGLVLGPLLYQIYINEFPNEAESYLDIFANDTKIIKSTK